MMNGFEDIQKLSKNNMEVTIKSLGAFSQGLQAIAVETGDYAKKSFEDGSAVVEKIAGAKTLDKAFEIQTDYARSAYEDFFGQMNKLGEMYVSVAKDAYKPYEGIFGSMGK